MPEPDWKRDLRDAIDVWVSGSDRVKEAALRNLLTHIDAAYERGLIAGRSQAGYRTRRKPREEERNEVG